MWAVPQLPPSQKSSNFISLPLNPIPRRTCSLRPTPMLKLRRANLLADLVSCYRPVNSQELLALERIAPGTALAHHSAPFEPIIGELQ
jgi:hypothetical protein